LILCISHALAFPSVTGDCTVLASPHAQALAGNGGYTMSGLPTSWTPGKTYTITISGNNGVRGLLSYVKQSTSAVTDTQGPRFGTFTPGGITQSYSCNQGATICHTSTMNNNKPASFAITWTAPPAGAGPLHVFALLCLNLNTQYQLVSADIPEGIAAPATSVPTSNPKTSAGIPTSAATKTTAGVPTSNPKTSAGVPTSNPKTSAGVPTSDYYVPPVYTSVQINPPVNPPAQSSANTPGGNNIAQAQSQNANGGTMGGLPAGVLIGVVVAAGVILLCCIANFIPIIIGRRQGKNPAQTHTVATAVFRATKAAFNRGGGDGHTRVYR